MVQSTKSRIILALDGMSLTQACGYVEALGPHIAGIKCTDLVDMYGRAVFGHLDPYRQFPHLLRMADVKIHDIGNTTHNRLSAWINYADVVTVHTSASSSALNRAAGIAKEKGLHVVGVTVLTDIDGESKRIYNRSATSQVRILAACAMQAQLPGIVCGPREVQMLRQQSNELLIFVPGVRKIGAKTDNHIRVGTHERAMFDGADYVVVGREITTAQNPEAVAKEINNNIAAVLTKHSELSAPHRAVRCMS